MLHSLIFSYLVLYCDSCHGNDNHFFLRHFFHVLMYIIMYIIYIYIKHCWAYRRHWLSAVFKVLQFLYFRSNYLIEDLYISISLECLKVQNSVFVRCLSDNHIFPFCVSHWLDLCVLCCSDCNDLLLFGSEEEHLFIYWWAPQSHSEGPTMQVSVSVTDT